YVNVNDEHSHIVSNLGAERSTGDRLLGTKGQNNRELCFVRIDMADHRGDLSLLVTGDDGKLALNSPVVHTDDAFRVRSAVPLIQPLRTFALGPFHEIAAAVRVISDIGANDWLALVVDQLKGDLMGTKAPGLFGPGHNRDRQDGEE